MFAIEEGEPKNSALVLATNAGAPPAQDNGATAETAVALRDSGILKDNAPAGIDRSGNQRALELERQRVFSEEAEIVNMTALTVVNSDGTEAAKLRHNRTAQLQKEVRVTDALQIVETDGNVSVRRCQQVEYRVRLRFIDQLFLEVPNGLTALEASQELEEPYRRDKCVDLCCQAFVCNFTNILCFVQRRRRNDDPAKTQKAKKKEIMTPSLQRGRARGWSMSLGIAFPLCRDIIRDVWVIAEFLTALIAFLLSVATISLGKNRGFHILHLILSLIATLLAFIDGILNIRLCRIYRTCKEGKAGNKQESELNIATDTTCCNKCFTRCERVENASDFIRMLAAELILYPLLVCDLFEFITGRGYDGGSAADILGIILFVLSLLALIFYTYIARLLVLGSTIYHMHRWRKLPNEDDDDRKIAKTALVFQVYFFIHVFGQMIAQILMLIAIGAKIQYDNRHLILQNTDETIRASSYLWYMLASGYIMPLCGILTFFLVTYYWTQEFPIGVCVDVLRFLEAPDVDTLIDMNSKLTIEERKKKLQGLSRYLHIAELKKDFKIMRKKGFFDKFAYPFQSPMIIVLSLIYAGFQLGFVVCAAVTVENGQTVSVFLNGGYWVYYYYIAVFIAALANLYIFLVAAIWLTIIIGIICLIVIIIGGCILCCIFASMISSSSNDNR